MPETKGSCAGELLAEKNGYGPPAAPQPAGLRARVTMVSEVKIHCQVQDGEGDCLCPLSYSMPNAIPRADPEGRGRTIGQRIDEEIARCEELRAIRDWLNMKEEAERAKQEAAAAAR